MKPIDIWRIQIGVSVTRHVTVPLVIGHDENDIGLRREGASET